MDATTPAAVIRKRMSQIEVQQNPAKVVSDLLWLSRECQSRCIYECSKWWVAREKEYFSAEGKVLRSNEVLCNLPSSHYEAYAEPSTRNILELGHEIDQPASSMTPAQLKHDCILRLVRSNIADREYRRAKFFLEKLQHSTPIEHFLYYFSWYMVGIEWPKRVRMCMCIFRSLSRPV